jgi:hypothetical protein
VDHQLYILIYLLIAFIYAYFEFTEEPVLKSWNETMLINLPEPESVTNIELKNGDIVFCCNFEDFNHIYLCKSSKNTIPQNNNFIIDASKIKGNYSE